ncbi:G-patch domain and KOW motifs-containing protein-like [Saccoglossus kowalevskii]|uniref:G patch domain and KOW motifs-containing protein-like n=1 Tax=Saccoglossus kowalevskii TaxID=10224 RepID=A0ABM0GNU2_SACKO|nr:PREDICTED: G patch domain and KOW motifs-containing protein-like [Saccoglossus kowalevskii]
MADEQTECNQDPERRMVSFGFSKKKEKAHLEKVSIINEDGERRKEDTDFVLSLEHREVQSIKPAEKKVDLVIPLITKNRWKLQTSDSNNEQMSGGLDQNAAQEILEDIAKEKEDLIRRSKENSNLAIPLLMKNKIPEGFETDDKLDTSLRPNEASAADYDEVPIEEYGMAMLRGMGWKPGEAIGGRFKQIAKPVDAVLRPKGLGLGADKRQLDALSDKKKKKLKPGDKVEEEEPQGFARGVGVLVASGPHKNLYGKIEGVDEDNSRVLVKFAISNQTANISQYAVKIVDKKEYRKYSLDISRLSKAHQDRKDEERRKQDKDRSEDRDNSDGYRHKDRESDRHNRDRHRDSYDRQTDKYTHRDRRKEDEPDSKKKKYKDERYTTASSDLSDQVYWLRPDLRVRIIDKRYKKGRYYNSKVSVVDVVTHDMCSCRTEDGKLLEELKQDMLETLIPKSQPGYIMVVNGKYKGQLGTVIDKDKSNCIAHVELLIDRTKIRKLSYDSICEYIGNIQEEQDY